MFSHELCGLLQDGSAVSTSSCMLVTELIRGDGSDEGRAEEKQERGCASSWNILTYGDVMEEARW